VSGRPTGARVHLRPIEAAWGEAFDCTLPCTAVLGPGTWSVNVAVRPGDVPLPIASTPLSLLANGSLDVRYGSRSRASGAVVLVLGSLAILGSLAGAISLFGGADDGSAGRAADEAIGYFLLIPALIPALAGLAMVIAGAALVSSGSTASVVWSPDP